MGRVVVCLVVLAQLAHADVKTDVDKLVRASLKAVAADKALDFDKVTAAARVLVLPNGKRSLDGRLVAELYGDQAKRVAHKLEDLHVVVDADAKLAWFHGAYTATFVVANKKQTLPMRVTGIVVDEGEPLGWKIQALMFARTLPDSELAAHATEGTRGEAKRVGDAAATKIVTGWFADGGSIARDRSKNVAAYVNGTDAAELGNGANAVKLVQRWEATRMWATAVEATPYADGEIAFVRADVMLPSGKLAARLVLGVILVKENGAWRWVAMSFSPVLEP